MNNIDCFTRSFLECALWSSSDDEGTPLDAQYDIRDIAAETLEKLISDGRMALTKAEGLTMKLEEHQKGAEDLRDLADLSTKPNEKRSILSLATGLESLAKLGENEALLLDVRAEFSE